MIKPVELEKTRGIVLNALRYSDSKLMVHIFTESHGSITCMVRCAKGRHRGAGSSLWQALTVLDMELDFKPHREVQTIREMNAGCVWSTLPYHPVKLTLALFLGEFLHHALRHEGENKALFRYIENTLTWLDECASERIGNFHIVMLLHMTKFLGFWPNANGYRSGYMFDLQDGVFTDTAPAHGAYIEAQDAQAIPLLLKMNLQQMHRVHMSRDERRHVLQAITVYYRLHVPEFGVIRSMEILHEMSAETTPPRS